MGFCLLVRKFPNLAVKQHGAIDHTVFFNTDYSIRCTCNTFLARFCKVHFDWSPGVSAEVGIHN